MTPPLAQVASSFIAPALAAAGVAAVTIPIAIHLLSRLRRKRQHWGAMRFLRLAYQKQKNRLRLEQWLLLATRCALMALIGLALAGPVVGGVVAAWFTGGGSGGRVVHVVLDDALTGWAGSGALPDDAGSAGGLTAFDGLKAEARALIEALGPDDRVAVWTTHRPPDAGALARPVATADRAAASRALGARGPAFVAADWAGTMEAVADEVGRGGGGGEELVVVLSDFARGDGALTEPTPSALSALGERATVAVRRPALGRPNRQVTAVTPRRGVVLADAVSGDALPVSVEATRFGDPAEPASSELVVELLESDAVPAGGAGADAPRVAASALQPVRWATGQRRVVVTVAVPMPALAVSAEQRECVLRVSLRSDAGADALPADDVRLAVVRVQRSWRVGVLDDGPASAGGGDGLSPGRFVAAALRGPGVEIEPLSTVSGVALEALSAVFVLAPQRLDEPAWSALSAFASGGGVVWLTPPGDAEASLTWLSQARRAFDLTWEPGPAVVALDEPAVLDVERGVPAALSLLAGEWAKLLGPVRVERLVPLGEVADAGWLWADTPSGPAALLAVRPWGRGALIVQAVAVDPAWSNLPTKPVFPALVQDALRSTLGRGLSDRVWLTGSLPELRGALTGYRLWRFDGGAGFGADAVAGEDDARPTTLGFSASDDTARADTAAFWPGVYRPSLEGAAPRFVVNLDADAADTSALSEAELTAWWDGLGPWAWLPENPAEVLNTDAPRVNLGWWLLWAVLGLVLVETWLSRVFSHAATQTAPLGRRALRALRHLRHAEAPGVPGGRRAA